LKGHFGFMTSILPQRLISTCCSKGRSKVLFKEVNDKLTLDQTHSYYYQVQTQPFVFDAQFCVYTFASDGDEENVNFERLDRNESFWLEECVPKAGKFFRILSFTTATGKMVHKTYKILQR